MLLLKLFLSFLQTGAFSFGGGYASLPLIQHQVIDINNWISATEFTDLVTISQMTPGPVAINAATFIGLRVGGILGAVMATLGCVLPSCIIVSIISYIYVKYRQMELLKGILSALRPAVIALIAYAGLTLLLPALWDSGLKIDMVVIFVVCVILLRKFRLNPVIVMLGAGVLKVIYGLIFT